jgi:hypothetical protein
MPNAAGPFHSARDQALILAVEGPAIVSIR